MSKPYLVVDLEATCDARDFPRDQTEIIEIGAVLVEPRGFRPIDEFQTFVRPIAHPGLTPFCTRLTSITQADVDAAPTFPQAVDALARWLPGPVLLSSWGAYDRNQLSRDRHRHGISLPLWEGAPEHQGPLRRAAPVPADGDGPGPEALRHPVGGHAPPRHR